MELPAFVAVSSAIWPKTKATCLLINCKSILTHLHIFNRSTSWYRLPYLTKSYPTITKSADTRTGSFSLLNYLQFEPVIHILTSLVIFQLDKYEVSWPHVATLHLRRHWAASAFADLAVSEFETVPTADNADGCQETSLPGLSRPHRLRHCAAWTSLWLSSLAVSFSSSCLE